FFVRVMQHAFRLRREWQLNRRRNSLSQKRAAFNLAANRFDRDLRAGEEPAGKRFVFAHQAEQQMLRLDRGRAELRSFITSEENYAAGFFSIAFEHSVPVS